MKNSLCILLCIFTHFKNTYLQHYTLNIAVIPICMLYLSYSYRFSCSLYKKTTKFQLTIKNYFLFRSWYIHNHHPRAGGILLDPTYTKILLVKDSYSGRYNIPKGKVNKGEDTLEAAKRQIIENTGFDPEENIEQENPVEIYPHKTDLHTLYFVNKVPSNDKTLFKYSRDNEIDDTEFLTIDEIKDNGYYGNTRKRVTKTVILSLSKVREFCILKRMENIEI